MALRNGLYGPVQTRTRHRQLLPRTVARQRGEDVRPDLSAGACMGLDGRVLGRYFGPDAGVFERTTARVICSRCPVAVDCLRDALMGPTDLDSGIRAGLDRPQRHRLRARVAAGADLDQLAERVIRERRLSPAISPHTRFTLRRGRWTSPRPLDGVR